MQSNGTESMGESPKGPERVQEFSMQRVYDSEEMVRLRELFLEPIGACNLECLMCQRWRWPSTMLPLKVVCSVIAEAQELGATRVRISGGEPLMWPPFLQLLRWLQGRRIKAIVYSNGILLSQEIARALAECDGGLSVSLDGLMAETHDRIRGKHGAFEKTMQGLKTFRDAKRLIGKGGNVSANFTIQDANISELKDTWQRIESFPIDQIRFALVHRPGKIALTDENTNILRSFVESAEGKSQALGIKMLCHPQLDAFLKGKISREALLSGYPSMELFEKNPVPCFLSYFSTLVSPEGYIYPCVHSFFDNEPYSLAERARESLGDIKIASLRSVWLGEGYRAFRQKMTPVPIQERQAACGPCEFYFKFLSIKHALEEGLPRAGVERHLNLSS